MLLKNIIRRLSATHPLKTVAVNLLLAAFIVFGMQLIAIVYAMGFTLYSSTVEIRNTIKVFIGDIDGDGDLDWVAGNRDNTDTFKMDSYTNDGSMTFSNSMFGTSLDVKSMKAADIDGDGDLDYLISKSAGVYKFVNNGSGIFTQYTVFTSGSASTGIEVADFNNDGSPDIVVVSSGTATSSIYLNDGHGNFTATPSTFPGAVDVNAADFNSDGALDLFITSLTDSKMYLNSGTGAFIQSVLIGVGGQSSLGDFDGDGDIDVTVTGNASSLVTPFFNNGLGTSLSLGSTFGNVQVVESTSIGDLDNDGDLDVIIAASDAAGTNGGDEIWINDGTGNFTLQSTPGIESDFTHQIAIGDLDDDGDLDYIAGTDDTSGSASGEANRIYTSDQAATSANTAPTAPTSISMTGALVQPSPRTGGTFANDTGVGTVAWNNVTNAGVEDGTPAVDGTTANGDITNYLKTTNYRFNIPSDATIQGVKVEVKKRRGQAGYTITDEHAYVLKAGLPVSTNYADTSTNWPSSFTYVTYGGPTDMWGLTLTPSDVNATNFGFSIAGQNNGAAASSGFEIDHIRMTVFYNVRNIRLSWGSGSDTETSTKMLQYQLKVGTGSNASNIVSAKTSSPNWVTRIVPNGQSRTTILKNLLCGHTYYWNVSTVDTGFKSTAGTEQEFTIDSSCNVSFSGGSSPPPPPPPSVGGGLSSRYFYSGRQAEGDALPGMGIISVSAFNDADGNGVQSSRERYGFKGLPMTASGRTADDIVMRKTMALGENGKINFDLPVSDDRGYWIGFDTGSSVIQGYTPTGLILSGAYVLRSGAKTEVSFGFRRSDLLSYKPCLSVGTAETTERKGTDAQILMQRLEDAFGQKISRGIDMDGELVTRKEFLTILSRSHCFEAIRDAASMKSELQRAVKKYAITVPLIDLAIDVTKSDALLVYTLMAKGADVTRITLRGDAADLGSPVTRGEAIRAVMSILDISKDDSKEGVLPIDLDPSDPLAPHFLALQSLDILPDSFHPVLGQSQGLTSEETALMVARTAFVGGKIALHAEPPNTKGLKKSAPVPTFLALLPPLKVRQCFEKDADRSASISFTDILPGDPFYFEMKDLLSRGTKNSAKHTMWLLAGTRRPTEFGIARGQTKVVADETVSVLETIRSLLVLACLPPDTAIDVKSGKANSGSRQGSGESRVARDRISGLPRDASFASRILYRAQDHQKEFDLSLFTYAPDFLRREERSPASGLSVGEASDLLASGLLMIHTKMKSLSPIEAENAFQELSAAISKELVSKDINWRDESILRTTPFTRGMLLSFLSTVVSGKTSVSNIPTTGSIPLGELWWERIDARK